MPTKAIKNQPLLFWADKYERIAGYVIELQADLAEKPLLHHFLPVYKFLRSPKHSYVSSAYGLPQD